MIYEEEDTLGYVLHLDGSPLYEACPDCPPDGYCLTCFDSGLIPHTHDEGAGN